MDELSPELRALLARGSAESQPEGADEERIRAKLAVSVAAFDGIHGVNGTELPDLLPGVRPPPASTGAAFPPGPAAGMTAGAGGASAWVAAGALLLAVTGYVVIDRGDGTAENSMDRSAAGLPQQAAPRRPAPLGVRPSGPGAVVAQPSRSDAESRAAPNAPVAPVAPVEAVEVPADGPARRPTRRSRPSRRRALRPSSVGTTNAQVVMLQAAARALHGGDAAQAASLLRSHVQRFPGSFLAPERDVLEVRTLCALGEDEAARERAAAFVEQHPNSPLAPRMQRPCPPR